MASPANTCLSNPNDLVMKAVTAEAIVDDDAVVVAVVALGFVPFSFARDEDRATGSVAGDDRAPSPLPSDSDESDADSHLKMLKFTLSVFILPLFYKLYSVFFPPHFSYKDCRRISRINGELSDKNATVPSGGAERRMIWLMAGTLPARISQ